MLVQLRRLVGILELTLALVIIFAVILVRVLCMSLVRLIEMGMATQRVLWSDGHESPAAARKH